MLKYLQKLVDPSTLPILVIVFFGVLIAFGILYVTSVDLRCLITHARQAMVPGLSAEIRTRLELESAAEVIKVFLDVYLLAVILLIFVPALYTLLARQSKSAVEQGVELAAAMFLSRVGDLTKWLIGVSLLRLMIRYFQKVAHLEVEDGLDLIYLTIVVLLVGSALLFTHHRLPKR